MSTPRSMFDLDGRTALITGGSRGLGLQMAEALGDYGARLIISARKSDELEKARTHLRARGIEVDWVAADTGKEKDIDMLVEATLDKLGHVDILVNNAGASWGAAAEDYPVEAWDKVFNLNMRGLFLLTQQIAKRSMIPRKHGRIINITSIAGLRGNPPGAMKTIAYNTSKGALANFTRTLAGEWGAYGITVNALAPGFFPTRMSRGMIENIGEKTLVAMTPLHRLGDAEDLKGATLLFASEAGKHITGQILAVDGGVSAV